MIILDTNVISALMLPRPDLRIGDWLDRQPAGRIWTTSVTVYELRRGVAAMPEGRRKRDLAAQITQMFDGVLNGRVVQFDAEAAVYAARIWADRRAVGQQVHIEDNMIAGIVAAHSATLATRDWRDFAGCGIAVISPWSD